MPPPRSRHVSPSSLTARSPCPLSPPLDLVNRRLDLINTVYSSTCALARQSMSSSVSHLRLVFRPPWTLRPSLSPSFTALGPSAQHVSTELLLSRRPSLCATPAHQHSQETCCTQPHAWFRLKLNRSLPDNHSS
jgi:hypothetical protein